MLQSKISNEFFCYSKSIVSLYASIEAGIRILSWFRSVTGNFTFAWFGESWNNLCCLCKWNVVKRQVKIYLSKNLLGILLSDGSSMIDIEVVMSWKYYKNSSQKVKLNASISTSLWHFWSDLYLTCITPVKYLIFIHVSHHANYTKLLNVIIWVVMVFFHNLRNVHLNWVAISISFV